MRGVDGEKRFMPCLRVGEWDLSVYVGLAARPVLLVIARASTEQAQRSPTLRIARDNHHTPETGWPCIGPQPALSSR